MIPVHVLHDIFRNPPALAQNIFRAPDLCAGLQPWSLSTRKFFRNSPAPVRNYLPLFSECLFCVQAWSHAWGLVACEGRCKACT